MFDFSIFFGVKRFPWGMDNSSGWIIYGLRSSEFCFSGNRKSGDSIPELKEDNFFSEEIRLMKGGKIYCLSNEPWISWWNGLLVVFEVLNEPLAGFLLDIFMFVFWWSSKRNEGSSKLGGDIMKTEEEESLSLILLDLSDLAIIFDEF